MSNITKTEQDFRKLEVVNNKQVFFWASSFSKFLGYLDFKEFEKVIQKTIVVFSKLKFSPFDHISKTINDDGENDYKLTRFACYLIVMNGDINLEKVSQAQAYFATQTQKLELLVGNQPEEIRRIVYRSELTEGNKSLMETAKKSGLNEFGYALFHDAGYMGMYNMRASELEKLRGLSKGKLMDHMGRTELAANLFRVTQTEENIKRNKVSGQRSLENVHKRVAADVRRLVKSNTGKTPEELPVETNLPKIETEIKKIKRKFDKDDLG